MNIRNCIFETNNALFRAGAIYTNNIDILYIANSMFTKNQALQENAGAVYLSCSISNHDCKNYS